MTKRSYNELAGLARMCARQARVSTAKDVARELWNVALEYQQEAAKLANGKPPRIGDPPPPESSMPTNSEPRKVPSEGDPLADKYRPIGIKCVAAAGGWNRKADRVNAGGIGSDKEPRVGTKRRDTNDE